MKNRILLLFIALLCCAATVLQGQPAPAGPEPKISPCSLTIESDSHQGYTVRLNFPHKELKNGWWKYLRKVAKVQRRKPYWKLSFPPEKGESNLPVEMYSQIKRDGAGTSLDLVLNASNMDAATKKEYLKQTALFLDEFQIRFHRDQLQARLANAEQAAQKISQQHQKMVARRLKVMTKLKKVKEKEQDGEEQEAGRNLDDELAALNKSIEHKMGQLDIAQLEIDRIKKMLLGYIENSRKK